MTRPITVGVDGSRESRAAADWAACEAGHRQLPVLLVHAWITEPLYTPPNPDREAAERLLAETKAELDARHPGLSISTELIPAVATTGLMQKAEEAEMLVLGSRGHTALVGFLLGSVGLPVISHAINPVVMVRPDRLGMVEEGDEVVVGLKDLGPPAETLLGFAFHTAAARGAAVRAVRAWGTPSLFSPETPAGEEPGASGIEAREGWALSDALGPWRQKFPRVPVIEHLRYGNASEVLLSAAAFEAGLVIVGRRRHRPVLGMRVGPVVHAALHHARPPVAVVPYG
jgi:nucleotide-binding universal stress UspA family protein